MGVQKPSIPKGTRDFSPQEMVRRNFIFQTIRQVFERYGYQPIETPAMENLSTLEGKYGEEGDKLLFRILNSGPVLDEFKMKNENLKMGDITEKGLRYDLTVPFARYVVQHQNEIAFPFKRYQIQPVWRADRPQKGRYREFYQCDADVIGSDSLLNEVELIQMIDEVYSKLGIPVTIKINNRKILSGLGEYLDIGENFMDVVIALDKYEKIGEEIYLELETKGYSKTSLQKLKHLVQRTLAAKPGPERSRVIKEELKDVEIAKRGLEEIEEIMNSLARVYISMGKKEPFLDFDLTLARGLNYYTGAIIEVKANQGSLTSSICGGGRYDDLTGIFGLPHVSGVGVSFGIDRIFDVMNELKLFEKLGLKTCTTQVLLANMGEAEREFCLSLAAQLRSAGINTEVYPDLTKKISKQFEYADKKQIPFVIVVGEEEMKSGQLSLKDMASGEQVKISITGIIEKLGLSHR